jgi:hypothetical protein
MRRLAQQTSVKIWFSNSIKILKPNRTSRGVYFKNRNPKLNYSLAIDEKTKKFLKFSKQSREKVFDDIGTHYSALVNAHALF